AGQKAQEAIYGTADGTNELLRNLTSGNYDAAFDHLTGGYNSLEEALTSLTGGGVLGAVDRRRSGINQSLGGRRRDDIQGARDAFASMPDALATMVMSGDADAAAAQFDALTAKAAEYGVSQEELLNPMPAYREAL